MLHESFYGRSKFQIQSSLYENATKVDLQPRSFIKNQK